METKAKPVVAIAAGANHSAAVTGKFPSSDTSVALPVHWHYLFSSFVLGGVLECINVS